MSDITIDYINTLSPDLKSSVKFTDSKTAHLLRSPSTGETHLKIYDGKSNELQDILTSHFGEKTKLEEFCEIPGEMFLVKASSGPLLLYPDDKNKYVPVTIVSYLYHHMKSTLTMFKGLSIIRDQGNFDFEIISKDGESCKVHSLVLSGVWPFFKNLQDSGMKEVADQRLQIPYPLNWIEAMISYFYKEDKDMGFIQATGVLVLADVYNVLSLKHIAIARIKKETLDITKCLEAWRNVYEARCEEMQLYLAKYLAEHLAQLHQASDLWSQYSQEEAIQLMIDISKSKLN